MEEMEGELAGRRGRHGTEPVWCRTGGIYANLNRTGATPSWIPKGKTINWKGLESLAPLSQTVPGEPDEQLGLWIFALEDEKLL
jgi:hypothetical protein